MIKPTFTPEEVARLHGCVLHQIAALWAPAGAAYDVLEAAKEVLEGMMAMSQVSSSMLTLALMLTCIYDEQLREIDGRRGMSDAKMLLARYEYAGKLEALRTKLESLIKGGTE